MNKVLVTGAARRVGRGIALWFARAGWDVAIHCRVLDADAQSAAQEIRNLGRKAVIVDGDLEDAAALGTIVPRAADALGGLDALINSAAIIEKGNVSDVTREQFERHHRINLWAPLVLSRDFAALEREGIIIHLSDALEKWSMSPDFAAYALSKHGLAHLMRLQSEAWAPRIRVNVIALGATLPAKGEEELFKKIAASNPSGRTSSVEEVCDTIRFFLDSHAVTGRIVSLEGAVSGGSSP
ncbi:MAG: SDR family oxidoreductase [Alphaproteobacteria bacterium]|nr:SDR family oxidoreductase [Alphaproteobacteria bacterium]